MLGIGDWELDVGNWRLVKSEKEPKIVNNLGEYFIPFF
jgi:hypothetical protein